MPDPPQKHDYALERHRLPACHSWFPTQTTWRRPPKFSTTANKVAMLVGAGALNAQDEVEQIARTARAGVAKSWLGKAVMPEDVPFCTGHIGLLGSKPSWDLMQECDTLLVVGSSFPYGEFYPKAGQAKGGSDRHRRPAPEFAIPDGRESQRRRQANAHRSLAAAQLQDRSRLAREDHRQCQGLVESHRRPRMTDGNNGLLNPERVFWELSPKLPDRCILAADSGTTANWYARDLKIRRGMMASGSGNLASMGAAVPYAVGAEFCFPDRVCIAVTGDGAMQMNGLNACITVAKYWKEWSDPRWITLC